MQHVLYFLWTTLKLSVSGALLGFMPVFSYPPSQLCILVCVYSLFSCRLFPWVCPFRAGLCRRIWFTYRFLLALWICVHTCPGPSVPWTAHLTLLLYVITCFIKPHQLFLLCLKWLHFDPDTDRVLIGYSVWCWWSCSSSHLAVDGEVSPGPSLLSADVLVELERPVSPFVDTRTGSRVPAGRDTSVTLDTKRRLYVGEQCSSQRCWRTCWLQPRTGLQTGWRRPPHRRSLSWCTGPGSPPRNPNAPCLQGRA